MVNGRIQLTPLSISTACAANAVAQFWLAGGDLYVSTGWIPQFYVLVGTSLILSLLLSLNSTSRGAVIALLLLRLVPMAIISIPEGAQLGIVGSLLIAFLADVVYYVRPPTSLIIEAMTVLATVSLLLPVSAWGRDVPRPSVLDILFLVVSASIITSTTERQKSWANKSKGQSAEIKRLDEAIVQLLEANMAFQQYADRIEEKSASEERERITREIHDSVGYSLLNIKMLMEEVALLAPEDHSSLQLCSVARDQAQAGLNETRRALRLLRATERRPVQTFEEIKRLVNAFETATGVRVLVEYGNLPFSLDDTSGEFVFHMLQEGMANALRHGKATRIRILFWLEKTELIVNIHDNGSGSPQIQEGIGLAGMRERLARVGGQLAAGNVEGGFQITARLPWAASGTTL